VSTYSGAEDGSAGEGVRHQGRFGPSTIVMTDGVMVTVGLASD